MNEELKFEEYLMEVCFEENPLVLDDDRLDFFDNWIGGGSMDDLIRHGDEYAEKITAQEKKRCAGVARKWVDEYMKGTVENADLDRLVNAIES